MTRHLHPGIGRHDINIATGELYFLRLLCGLNSSPIAFVSTANGSAVPRSASTDGLDKFRRYHPIRHSSGMKPLRVRVPDPHAPGFQEEAHRQAVLLKSTLEQRDALGFIEASAGRDEAARETR